MNTQGITIHSELTDNNRSAYRHTDATSAWIHLFGERTFSQFTNRATGDYVKSETTLHPSRAAARAEFDRLTDLLLAGDYAP